MATRIVSGVHPVVSMGPDGQALKKNLILKPGEWQKSDPFLLMAEDWFSKDGGFPDHPHRGFETVTLILDGELEHSDSKGNRGVLRAGDVQWMTAAGGIVHSEEAHGDSVVHSLQLWLNLPSKAKMGSTHYQDLLKDKIPSVVKNGVTARVISGEHGGVKGLAQNVVPVLALDVTMKPSSTFETEVPAGWNGFLYVLDGKAKFGAHNIEIAHGSVAYLPPSNQDAKSKERDRLQVTTDGVQGAHFIFFAGEPIREPVVARGPFVMNSQEGINQAFRDYQSGTFIH